VPRPLQIATGKPDRSPLGLARIAKQLSFHRVETGGGREKAIAVRIPNDDSRRLRADFNDENVRHARAPFKSSVPVENRAGAQEFRGPADAPNIGSAPGDQATAY